MARAQTLKSTFQQWWRSPSPWSCVSCQAPTIQLKALCHRCEALLLEKQISRKRNQDEIAVWHYEPLLERTIHRLRQQESLLLLQQLATMMRQWLAQEADSISAVVAAPARPRGLNISTLPARLSQALARAIGPHCLALDPFSKNLEWQQHGRKHKSRTSAPLLLQMAKTQQLQKGPAHGKILLLDDLVVTGTTLGQTATWLQDRGYIVRPLALARNAPQIDRQRLQSRPLREQPNPPAGINC